MTYKFTKDTPWGNKGEEANFSGYSMEKMIMFLFQELGVVEDGEWKPQEDQVTYFINDMGGVSEAHYIEISSWKGTKDFLGVFPTREEAEQRRDQIKEFIKTL